MVVSTLMEHIPVGERETAGLTRNEGGDWGCGFRGGLSEEVTFRPRPQ